MNRQNLHHDITCTLYITRLQILRTMVSVLDPYLNKFVRILNFKSYTTISSFSFHATRYQYPRFVMCVHLYGWHFIEGEPSFLCETFNVNLSTRIKLISSTLQAVIDQFLCDFQQKYTSPEGG